MPEFGNCRFDRRDQILRTGSNHSSDLLPKADLRLRFDGTRPSSGSHGMEHCGLAAKSMARRRCSLTLASSAMSISSPLCAPEAVVRADMPVGPYFFALGVSKKIKSLKCLVPKRFSAKFLEQGAKPIFEKPKVPPPRGGLAGKLNNFTVRGSPARS